MKIAIVKLSALGDIVHAMVALQFIKPQVPLRAVQLQSLSRRACSNTPQAAPTTQLQI